LKETRPLWPPQWGVGLQEPNLGKTNPRVSLTYSLAICFAPSLADSFIFLTLTRLVVVFIFVNFSFALFTPPPLGDYQCGAPSRSSCWEMGRSSTTATPRASSSDAFPSPKARSSYKRYTRGLVAITQHLEPLLETPSDKVSTGRRRWPTPLELSAPAKGVSSTQGRPTCLLRPCRPYPSPGHLLCGV
jgi:hypothetical protein